MDGLSGKRRSLLFTESVESEDFKNEIKEIDEILGEDNIKHVYPESYMKKLNEEYEEIVKLGKEFRGTIEADMKSISELQNMKLDESILTDKQKEELRENEKAIESYLQTREEIRQKIEMLRKISEPHEEYKRHMKTADDVIKKIVFKK